MMSIRAAEIRDVEGAVAMLAEAFADDPLMHFFFGGNADGIKGATTRFFSILMRARLGMGAPVLVGQSDGLRGVAMGYGVARPDWPKSLEDEWDAFEADLPGLADRFTAYDRVSDACKPREDHYYLGVLGVAPASQGAGTGRALLKAFCDLSRASEGSQGVYLETATPTNVRFYERHGFAVRGEADLGGVHLWCMFRPNPVVG
jgi:GNAT superfamily N-acetyltransferase